MIIHYLFSTRKRPASQLISWAAKFEKLGLKTNPSHVALLLNNELVVESTFCSGVRILPYNSWVKINHEIAKIEAKNIKDSNSIISHISNVWGKDYDWLGIIYFMVAYIKLIIFNISLPLSNKFHNKNKYFCTELVGKLSNNNYEMTSPAGLLKKLEQQ